MSKRITKVEKEQLALLAEAEAGFLYMATDEISSIIERSWAEQNPGMVEDGKLATRLTPEGLEKHESLKKPKLEEKVEEPEAEEKWGQTEPEKEETPSLFGQLEKAEKTEEVASPVGKPELPHDPEPKPKQALEIEKNVPVPPRTARLRGAYKYPFAEMEVGDSFHVAKTEDRPNPSRTLASTVSTASKKHGKLFSVRTVKDDDPKGAGARVFRLE
jgi:hypothetical protein